MILRHSVAIALLTLSWQCATHAALVHLDVSSRMLIAAQPGEPPRYELITGTYSGVLDPQSKRNSIITDLPLAVRDASGDIVYSATFALTRPLNPSEASGVLFYDVPNRGNATAVADEDGHIHVVSGWQGDIPAAPGLQTATVPVGRHADGSPVTGPVLVRFVDIPAGRNTARMVAGIGAGVPRPAPLSLDTSKASLMQRRSDAKPGVRIAASDWAFADCSQTPFPGRPDSALLCLKKGFDPQSAYELTYMAKDPPVLGIGFAAVRDLVTFLRYERGTAMAPNPVAGQVQHAIATGISQSGNFLRSFIRLGFNSSEAGRIVFDGVNPHIAARQLPMNLRFGVPGGAAGAFEPGSEGVLWWGNHDDRARGRGVSSLLDRCRAEDACPKVMETFGAAEFWGLRMSADLVGIDARADIPLPSNVRRYYFPGVTHGGGSGDFATRADELSKVPGCELPANPNPMFYSMRALRRALVAWVVDGKEPPASRYPRLDAGDLVQPRRAAMGFPVIPRQPSPDGKLNPLSIYDFGSTFRAEDLSGEMAIVPPKLLRVAPSLVPRVDADGNELSGVPSVHVRVPLGTYLGWNVQAEGYYRGRGCGFQGGYIPFARTKAQRMASGDPRLSLEERYATHEGFVAKVRAAAADLVKEGFLLTEDMPQIVEQAERSTVLRE